MKETEFRRLADAYGADLARWPERVRAAARAVEREPWASAILVEAGEVDDLFSGERQSVSPQRVDRVTAAVNARVASTRQAPSLRDWLAYLLAPVSSVAAASLLGVWLGLGGMQAVTSPETGVAQFLSLAMSFDDPSFLLGGG